MDRTSGLALDTGEKRAETVKCEYDRHSSGLERGSGNVISQDVGSHIPAVKMPTIIEEDRDVA